jgi:regulator of protease activity HflC (stomatin/prohibitin superfamily)
MNADKLPEAAAPFESEKHGEPVRVHGARGCLAWVYRRAASILLVLFILFVVFSLARASIYKIRPYERGLHLRGGSFVGIDQPGWHVQIPFVDTVIGLNVVERPGTIEQLQAMTADEVTMDVTLLYTYRVADPVRYALEVTEPEKIVARFVEGTLRDVVNGHKMDEVMHSRVQINTEVMAELQKREQQYGVQFVLVQIQNAAPPSEVLDAIKDRMVAVQLQEKASAEAEQQRTLADSQFYTAQKQADGEAYQIAKLAEAQATSIQLSSEAKVAALRQILAELDGKGTLAEQYIQVLIAQELRENSKWVISSGSTPILDMREISPESTATTAP